MSFAINTATDEQLFRSYTSHRDAVRDVMGHGVYPNLRRALSVYAAFDTALAGDLADHDLLAYHQALMAAIDPYVSMLRAAAAQIVEVMDMIEANAPGTFGIAPTYTPSPLPPEGP